MCLSVLPKTIHQIHFRLGGFIVWDLSVCSAFLEACLPVSDASMLPPLLGITIRGKWMLHLVVLWKCVSGLRRSFMHCGRGLCVVIVVSLPLLPSVLSMCCMLLWSLVFRSLLVYVLFCFPFYFDRSFSHDSCLDFTSCFYKFLQILFFICDPSTMKRSHV